MFREIEDKKIVVDENSDFNFLLEGDNLHSLKLLEKTHKGKIDVIHIENSTHILERINKSR